MDNTDFQNYSPGDPELIDKIVCQLKFKGIFDQLRKECISDVDTKPAYHNLHQRVDSTVSSYLAGYSWRPDLNKNQLRDTLRRHVQNGGFLEAGVRRIVEQVVKPKIGSVFVPQVEDLVYSCLGIDQPQGTEPIEMCLSSEMMLRPSPFGSSQSHCGMLTESESAIAVSYTTKTEEPVIKTEERIIKTGEPIFKAHEPIVKAEESIVKAEERESKELGQAAQMVEEDSNDSHLSGMSELTSHGSPNPIKQSFADDTASKAYIEPVQDDSLSDEVPKTPTIHLENSDGSSVEFDSFQELNESLKLKGQISSDDSSFKMPVKSNMRECSNGASVIHDQMYQMEFKMNENYLARSNWDLASTTDSTNEVSKPRSSLINKGNKNREFRKERRKRERHEKRWGRDDVSSNGGHTTNNLPVETTIKFDGMQNEEFISEEFGSFENDYMNHFYETANAKYKTGNEVYHIKYDRFSNNQEIIQKVVTDSKKEKYGHHSQFDKCKSRVNKGGTKERSRDKYSKERKLDEEKCHHGEKRKEIGKSKHRSENEKNGSKELYCKEKTIGNSDKCNEKLSRDKMKEGLKEHQLDTTDDKTQHCKLINADKKGSKEVEEKKDNNEKKNFSDKSLNKNNKTSSDKKEVRSSKEKKEEKYKDQQGAKAINKDKSNKNCCSSNKSDNTRNKDNTKEASFHEKNKDDSRAKKRNHKPEKKDDKSKYKATNTSLNATADDKNYNDKGKEGLRENTNVVKERIKNPYRPKEPKEIDDARKKHKESHSHGKSKHYDKDRSKDSCAIKSSDRHRGLASGKYEKEYNDKSNDGDKSKERKKDIDVKNKKSHDYCSRKEKHKEGRRSTDRDSNGTGGGSQTRAQISGQSLQSKATESSGNHRMEQKTSEHSSNSDAIAEIGFSSAAAIENITSEISSYKLNTKQLLSARKPKIASNIYEVRKIIQARKNIQRLEQKRLKENEQSMSNTKMNDREDSARDELISLVDNVNITKPILNLSKIDPIAVENTDLMSKVRDDIVQTKFETAKLGLSNNGVLMKPCNDFGGSVKNCDSEKQTVKIGIDLYAVDEAEKYQNKMLDVDMANPPKIDLLITDEVNKLHENNREDGDRNKFSNLIRISGVSEGEQTENEGLKPAEANDFKGFDPKELEEIVKKLQILKHCKECLEEAILSYEQMEEEDLVTSEIHVDFELDSVFEKLSATVIRQLHAVLPPLTEDNYTLDNSSGTFWLKANRCPKENIVENNMGNTFTISQRYPEKSSVGNIDVPVASVQSQNSSDRYPRQPLLGNATFLGNASDSDNSQDDVFRGYDDFGNSSKNSDHMEKPENVIGVTIHRTSEMSKSKELCDSDKSQGDVLREYDLGNSSKYSDLSEKPENGTGITIHRTNPLCKSKELCDSYNSVPTTKNIHVEERNSFLIQSNIDKSKLPVLKISVPSSTREKCATPEMPKNNYTCKPRLRLNRQFEARKGSMLHRERENNDRQAANLKPPTEEKRLNVGKRQSRLSVCVVHKASFVESDNVVSVNQELSAGINRVMPRPSMKRLQPGTMNHDTIKTENETWRPDGVCKSARLAGLQDGKHNVCHKRPLEPDLPLPQQQIIAPKSVTTLSEQDLPKECFGRATMPTEESLRLHDSHIPDRLNNEALECPLIPARTTERTRGCSRNIIPSSQEPLLITATLLESEKRDAPPDWVKDVLNVKKGVEGIKYRGRERTVRRQPNEQLISLALANLMEESGLVTANCDNNAVVNGTDQIVRTHNSKEEDEHMNKSTVLIAQEHINSQTCPANRKKTRHSKMAPDEEVVTNRDELVSQQRNTRLSSETVITSVDSEDGKRKTQHYNSSELYKPRPSLSVTTRRSRAPGSPILSALLKTGSSRAPKRCLPTSVKGCVLTKKKR